MNATILKGAQSFRGVGYSENKCKKGDAELIAVDNFTYLFMGNHTESQYVKYLEEWSNRNDRIKKPQFHVSISEKGKVSSKEEMLFVARAWLNEMGYKGVPVMFYFHNDTDNNHIHIVSSRVGVNGEKIDHHFEKRRSREIINRLTGNDLCAKCKIDFNKALEYNFQSISQFETVLMSMGYQSKIVEGKINVYREGKHVLEQNTDTILLSVNEPIKNRREAQLRAIFRKYSIGMSFKDFISFMQEKFGVAIVPFGKKDSPYGYTVIDHSTKSVFKGNNIMKINTLLTQNIKHEETVRSHIEVDLIKKQSSYDINKALRKFGVFIKEGNVIVKSSGSLLFALNAEQKEMLRYNNLLRTVNTYQPTNINEVSVLSKIYSVNTDDVTIERGNAITDNEENLKSMLHNMPMQDVVALLDLRKVSDGENEYLIDYSNHHLYSLKYLGLDRVEETVFITDNTSSLPEQEERSDIIDAITEYLADTKGENVGGGTVNNELPKKRKR